MAQYRIVRDTYAGYEVQVRRWWFPFWVQLGFSNTHTSVERAEAWSEATIKKEVKRLRKDYIKLDN
jgi:hypothetical protein